MVSTLPGDGPVRGLQDVPDGFDQSVGPAIQCVGQHQHGGLEAERGGGLSQPGDGVYLGDQLAPGRLEGGFRVADLSPRFGLFVV
jgi:hypothetical protein